MKTAIYAGSFDPFTLGHLDILKRALAIFDEVIVAIAKNAGKNPMFTFEERYELIAENIKDLKGAKIEILKGLTIDFAKKNNAVALIRGLRVMSDFEYEFQLAQMNRHMNSEIETILLMPSSSYFFTSSTLIREVSHFNADKIKDFVPKNVLKALIERNKQ
ncbi:MAG: pantetheine-phosphate adenylyltransferase [Opitutales bacterium]